MIRRSTHVLAAAGAVAVLSVVLAACTGGQRPSDTNGSSASSSPTSTPPSSNAASETPSGEGDEQEGTPIRITIGDQTLDATVWDTPTGQDLLSRLPLTLDFEDLSNQEKVGHVDPELTMEGMPEGDDPLVGDLGYYAPWGNVVLYYGDVGYWDGIARIGTIHGDLSVISDQTGDFTATLERAG